MSRKKRRKRAITTVIETSEGGILTPIFDLSTIRPSEAAIVIMNTTLWDGTIGRVVPAGDPEAQIRLGMLVVPEGSDHVVGVAIGDPDDSGDVQVMTSGTVRLTCSRSGTSGTVRSLDSSIVRAGDRLCSDGYFIGRALTNAVPGEPVEVALSQDIHSLDRHEIDQDGYADNRLLSREDLGRIQIGFPENPSAGEMYIDENNATHVYINSQWHSADAQGQPAPVDHTRADREAMMVRRSGWPAADVRELSDGDLNQMLEPPAVPRYRSGTPADIADAVAAAAAAGTEEIESRMEAVNRGFVSRQSAMQALGANFNVESNQMRREERGQVAGFDNLQYADSVRGMSRVIPTPKTYADEEWSWTAEQVNRIRRNVEDDVLFNPIMESTTRSQADSAFYYRWMNAVDSDEQT